MFAKRFYAAGITLGVGYAAWMAIHFSLSQWLPYFTPALYWSLVVVVISFLIYYFFHDSFYHILGLDLLTYLEAIHLLVFCFWALNVLAQVINLIPLIIGRDLWIHYLLSAPWMFACFWSIFILIFLIMLHSYWSDNAYLAQRQY